MDENGDIESEYNDTMLPTEVAESIGLTDAVTTHLATLNDNGSSFPEIARWIAQNL